MLEASRPSCGQACTGTLSACRRSASWERGFSLLCAISVDGVRANIISINSAISICDKASLWSMGGMLLQHVRDVVLEQDIITKNSAISICGKATWKTNASDAEEPPLFLSSHNIPGEPVAASPVDAGSCATASKLYLSDQVFTLTWIYPEGNFFRNACVARLTGDFGICRLLYFFGISQSAITGGRSWIYMSYCLDS